MFQAVLAQATDTSVTIPWGSWISSVAGAVQPVLTLALTGIATYLMAAYIPPWMKLLSGSAAQTRVNEVLTKAVASAVARVQGAVMGKESTVTIASEILRKAMQYAVGQAPDLIKTAAKGSVDNLQNMVLARMEEAGVTPKSESGGGEAVKAATKDFDFDKAIKGHLS